MVIATAQGFKQTSTQPLRFTAEGQKGVVELTLEPDVRTLENVPVKLLTPEGKPIARTVVPQDAEQGQSIECRAVDAITGKPVAGAIVKTVVRLLRDETGASLYRPLETRTTTTGPAGQFTVLVPQKYLTDTDPLRSVDLFVTVSHPGYVTDVGFAHPRQITKEGVTDQSADFRLVKLEPAKEIYGQAVDAEGRPLSATPVYKEYDDIQTHDADNPIKTDQEGRFRTKVVARVGLNLEFRSLKCGRNYQRVPLDRTDLGVLRISDGVRVTGRVVDAHGQPVRGVMVTAPLQSKTESQPNFCYHTDKEGRFTTDKLAPGKYLFTVGGIYSSDGLIGFPIADAPGLYVPLPLEIRAGQPVAELTLRPTENVVRTRGDADRYPPRACKARAAEESAVHGGNGATDERGLLPHPDHCRTRP